MIRIVSRFVMDDNLPRVSTVEFGTVDAETRLWKINLIITTLNLSHKEKKETIVLFEKEETVDG